MIHCLENERLEEKIYRNTLSSGCKCYIIPKYGYQEKIAAVTFGYGSVDTVFLNRQGERIQTPAGMAHFIEHKLFENPDGNAMDLFTKNGAMANAFTDFNKTAYYFSCGERFYENLEILLHFVTTPYFTEESAQREKGIISQEIAMYEDDPSWKVYFQMLRGMYCRHGVRENIAGSQQSIQQIGKDLLYECYRAFYTPENMAIVCVGDVDPEKILEISEKHIQPIQRKKAKTISFEEPETVQSTFIQEQARLAKPLFSIGIKQSLPNATPQEICARKICLNLLFGEPSDLYRQSWSANELFGPLGMMFSYGREYAFTTISGEGKDPQKFFRRFQQAIEKTQKIGLREQDFQRTIKKQKGRFLRGLNSIQAIAMSQLDTALIDISLFDMYHWLDRISRRDVEKVLEKNFSKDRMTISILV